MANTILTSDIIAREALMVLRNNAVMPSLVHRDYSDEFVAGRGDTIRIRKPATFTANEFSNEITVQSATETKVTVTMDKLLDVSFAVTAKDMTLSIEDFSKQFLVPAMQSFANKVDSYLLALQSEVTSRTARTTDVVSDLIDTRKALTANAAPLADRRFVFGSDDEAALLKTDLFISADKVGDDGTALREASLGRKFGLDCYVDQNIDDITNTPAIAFHKNAFALVTRMLHLPSGAANASIVNYDGLALRVVYGYDQSKKTDIVSIDMLCGVKTLDEKLASVMVIVPAPDPDDTNTNTDTNNDA